MLKKLIFLNVMIISVLVLGGCGPITVKLPDVDVSGGVPDISITLVPADPVAPPAAAPAAAPSQGFFGNNLLIYIVVGLVVLIAMIALVAVASRNNSSRPS